MYQLVAKWQPQSIRVLCMRLGLNSGNCEDKFVQEHGVVRLWEVMRFNNLRGAVFYFLAT